MWGWIAIGGVGVLAARRVFGGVPEPREPGKVLAPRELATLEAVSEALFPAGGAIAPSGAEAGVAAYVDRLAAAAQPRQRTLMRALFFLIEHATLVFPAPGGLRGMRRYSRLDAAQRVAVIEAWQHSGWFVRRLVFTSLRALCTLGYFADPGVLHALRLSPYAIETPVVAADLLYPPIGRPLAAIAWTAEDLTPPPAAGPLDLDGPRMARTAEPSAP